MPQGILTNGQVHIPMYKEFETVWVIKNRNIMNSIHYNFDWK